MKTSHFSPADHVILMEHILLPALLFRLDYLYGGASGAGGVQAGNQKTHDIPVSGDQKYI